MKIEKSNLIMWSAAILLFVGALGMPFDQRNRTDFRIYYFSGKCVEAGLTPYSVQNLSSFSPVPIEHPNVYPPYVLPLFVPLSLLSYSVANIVFLVIELFALAALIWIWTDCLFNSRLEAPFALFVILGFSSTLVVDLAAGNVAMIESLPVWIALALFVRGRIWGFAVLLVVAALIKLTPLYFLWLVFLPNVKTRFRPAAFVIIFVLALHVCTYAAQPNLYVQWLRVTRNLDAGFERGSINPAVLPLLKDVAGWAESLIHRPIPSIVPFLISTCVAVYVLLRTWLVSKRLLLKSAVAETMPAIISLAVLAAALCLPRFKDYSYVLLLGPGFFAIKWCRRRELALAVVVLAMLPNDTLLWTGIFGGLAREYYVLIMAAVLWFMLAREMCQRATDSSATFHAEQMLPVPEARSIAAAPAELTSTGQQRRRTQRRRG